MRVSQERPTIEEKGLIYITPTGHIPVISPLVMKKCALQPSPVSRIELDPAAPGYKRIVFQPQPGGGLTHAKQKLETAYGPVSMEWTIADGKWTMEFSIPPNASASLVLPGGTKEYGSGTHRVEVAWS